VKKTLIGKSRAFRRAEARVRTRIVGLEFILSKIRVTMVNARLSQIRATPR
jgi:hypothetical protein